MIYYFCMHLAIDFASRRYRLVEIYLERYTAHSSELVVNCVAIYLMYLHAT